MAATVEPTFVHCKISKFTDTRFVMNLRKVNKKTIIQIQILGSMKYTSKPFCSFAEVKYTLIMTYMRSGSTITSRLLKTNDTFFFFEPFQGLLRDHRTNQHVCYPHGYCRFVWQRLTA